MIGFATDCVLIPTAFDLLGVTVHCARWRPWGKRKPIPELFNVVVNMVLFSGPVLSTYKSVFKEHAHMEAVGSFPPGKGVFMLIFKSSKFQIVD